MTIGPTEVPLPWALPPSCAPEIMIAFFPVIVYNTAVIRV